MLVDEFQDCDELQIEFIKLINQGMNYLQLEMKINVSILLEVLNQSIWLILHSSFKNGKKVYLTTNYRSKKNIVDISKKVNLQ